MCVKEETTEEHKGKGVRKQRAESSHTFYTKKKSIIFLIVFSQEVHVM